jgi:hypothetical protein
VPQLEGVLKQANKQLCKVRKASLEEADSVACSAMSDDQEERGNPFRREAAKIACELSDLANLVRWLDPHVNWLRAEQRGDLLPTDSSPPLPGNVVRLATDRTRDPREPLRL